MTQQAQRVLVTGGSGFIGGWCIVELIKRGYEVRATLRSRDHEAAIRRAVAEHSDAGDRLSFRVLDLNSDTGWAEAAVGCDYVLHVASPLGIGMPKDPRALIAPAVDGTLRVLRAAAAAGVKRVVLTSSCAAASPRRFTDGVETDETLWTDAGDPKLGAYRKSKTLAEKAAWDFMAGYQGPMQLTTILPGAVFGPVLWKERLGSVSLIQRLLQGKVPRNPRLGFQIVDVRDLADLHIRAMTSPAAAGERFIAVGDFLWVAEVSNVLRARLGEAAARVPRRPMPDWVLRAMALFSPTVRELLPGLGRRHRFSAAKARDRLGWRSRASSTAVGDCAASLIR